MPLVKIIRERERDISDLKTVGQSAEPRIYREQRRVEADEDAKIVFYCRNRLEIFIISI